MAERHIADKESKFVAVNGPPDICRVGKDYIPFDISDKLSQARDPSSNVFARDAEVLTLGTRINSVQGDAGSGLLSGCSKGHTIVLTGSTTVFTNGKPTAFHGSKVGMNCNGSDTFNCTGDLRTQAMPPKPKWGSKEKSKELQDNNKANREALADNPMGKTQEEATALHEKVQQNIADAARNEQAAFQLAREGGSTDLATQAMQTRQDAYNMLAEAERQVRYANPTSQALAGIAVGQIPGSGLVDAGKDLAQASQQAGQGNLWSAAGSAAMGVFGAVTELPGLKQIKGLVKGGKAIDKLGDAKKAAELKKAADLKKAEEAKKAADAKKAKEAEDAKQTGPVIEKKKKAPGPCDHLKQGSGTGPYRGGAHSKTSKPVNDGKDSHHAPADDVSPIKRSDGPAIQMDPKDHAKTSSNGSSRDAVMYRQLIEKLLKDGKWRDAMAIEIKDIRDIAKEIKDPRKYNEAAQEMLEYFKCLEKNGLLPKG
jgi:Domain of unknown function (DUF4150)